MANKFQSNNNQPILYAQDSSTGLATYVTATGHKLDTGATISASSLALNDGVSTTTKATVAALTNSNPLAVEIVDGSGTQITSFGGGTQYANGSAQATPTGTVALGWDGANVRALATDNTGKLSLGTVTVSGTVTANAGTNLNTSALALETGGNLASIKADVDNLNLAQASTTAGQKGNLVLGAVTTAAPTYVTAQSNPLSLTTAGLLRVDGSGVTQPVSLTSTTITGTVSNNVAQVGGSNVAATGVAGALAVGGTATNGSLTSAATNPLIVAGSDYGGTPRLQNLKVDSSGLVYTNISSFGGNAVVTGTGASGVGIPRVTVSNDSNVLATQSGTWTVQPGNTQNTTPWLAAPSANTGATGVTVFMNTSLSNTKTAVKGTAGNFHGLHATNFSNSAVTWLQFFNKTTANVTVGSTTPDFIIGIPPGGAIDNQFPIPYSFSNALTVAATTTSTGSTAPTIGIPIDVWYI